MAANRIPDEGQRYLYRQEFLQAGTWLDRTELPAVNCFVVHPCLNAVIANRLPTERQAAFVDCRFIAGNGLRCPESLEPIKYCVTLDPETRALIFCHFPRGVDDLTPTIVRQHAVDDLSDVTTAPVALFLALICASCDPVDGGYVNKERLLNHVTLLRQRGLIHEAYGKNATREVAENYFLNLMTSWCDQQPQVVTTMKEKLSKFLPALSLKHQSGSDGSANGLRLIGLRRSEILIAVH